MDTASPKVMKVAVGVPCREQGRYSTFWECVNRLRVPSGVQLVEPIVRYDNSVARARNKIATEALKQDLDAVFWLDDDMLFSRDVLARLLARPEDIIIGLTLSRCLIDGHTFRPIWSDTEMVGDEWEPVTDIKVGPNGLMPLLSGTGGGVLTRMGVFKLTPAPWWTIGAVTPDMFWEDIIFYRKMRAAGVKIWGDPSVRFGHYQSSVVWPNQQPDGSWSTVLAHGFEGFLELPWAKVPEEAAV
jgi:hypothetical protein